MGLAAECYRSYRRYRKIELAKEKPTITTISRMASPGADDLSGDPRWNL